MTLNATTQLSRRTGLRWPRMVLTVACCLAFGVAWGCGAPEDTEAPQAPPDDIHGEHLTEVDRVVKLAVERRERDATEARELLEQALDMLEDEADPARESRVRSQLARTLTILGQSTAAEVEAREALELATAADDPREIAFAAYTLGAIHHFRGNYERVLELTELTRTAAERAGDPAGVAEAHNMTGVVHRNRGEFAEALAHLLEGLSIAEELEDQNLQAVVLNNLGLVYWNLTDLEGAQDAFHRALQFERDSGDLRSESLLLNNIGLVREQQGDLEGALESYLRARDLKEQIGDRRSLAATLNNLGLLYREMGRVDDALAQLESCLELREDLGDRRGTAKSLISFSPGGAPRRSRCDLTGIVVPLLDDLGATDVEIRLEIDDDLPLVEADALQLREAIRNVVVNAVESGTAEAGVDVTVTSQEDGRCVRIEVADRGGGVDSDLGDRVFEPFFTTRDGASGLGLTAAHTTVSHHGGRLSHRPRPGGGTVFVIDLPSTEPADDVPSRTASSGDATKGRVLVVEDDPSVQDIYRSVLPALGYDVVIVAEGPAAVEVFGAEHSSGREFDVVLIDLCLPGGMHGHDVFRELRAIDPGVVAVVASGYSDDPVLANHRDHGFAGALGKPFTLAQLEAMLTAVTR